MAINKSNHIKIKLLVPFVIALVLILICIQSILYFVQQNEQNAFASKLNQEIDNAFEESLKLDTNKFSSFISFIMQSSDIQQAWLTQDRASLIRLSTPIFQRLKLNHNVTHLYFHTTNGHNFLRTHATEKFGDAINRASFQQAVDSNKTTSGIELRTSGQFVLRVVKPWVINGKTVGYIELGEEIEHIIHYVESLHKTPIILSVNKDFITQKSLKDTEKFKQIYDSWDKYKNTLIINQTINSIPTSLINEIESRDIFKPHIIKVKGVRHLTSSIFIKDFLKQDIGKITYLYNIENKLNKNKDTLLVIIGIYILISLFLSVFYYIYSGKIEHSLQSNYKKLKSEINDRQQAEMKLLKNKRELEQLLIDRDRSLLESKNRYQTLFDKSADALMLLGGDKFIDCNQATLDMFQYNSKEEIYNTHPSQISPEFQDDEQASSVKANEMIHAAIKTGSHRFEWNHARKNGEVFPAEVLLTAIPSNDGPLVHAVVRDISARKKTEDEIKFRAYYDSLTKLPNRQLLLDRLGQTIAVSKREGNYNALLFIDLDRFKTINDSLGHAIGDLLLIETARRIKSCIREIDTAARFGGDEYIVLLKHVGKKQEEASFNAKRIAENLHKSFNKVFKLQDQEIHMTCSIGICIFPLSDESVEDIIKHADTAMYSAKDSGRNKVAFYLSEMHENVTKRLMLEKDLRLAVKNRQLAVHYQPQLNNHQQVIGVEALVRWSHPEHGFINPEEFISIAEETGIIYDLGDFVLEQAITDILSLQEINCMPRHLSVNISPHQFRHVGFVAQIKAVINQHHLEHHFLTLEVTEGVAINNLNDTIEKFKELRDIGIRMSLDDFGTGYSSLSYLKRLPLDELKIDKSFVFDVLKDPHDALLVQTIINIANEFGLDTVAEGVEDEGQLNFLKAKDCKYYQGYHYSRPLPIEQLKEFLQQNNNLQPA